MLDLKEDWFMAKKAISINAEIYQIVENEDVELIRTHIRNDKLYVVLKNVEDNEVEMLYDIFNILFVVEIEQ